MEWLFHIALDNLETAFKVSKQAYGINTYNFFQFGLANSGYIHLDFDRCFDDELKEMAEKGITPIEPEGKTDITGRIGFLHPRSTRGVLIEFAQHGTPRDKDYRESAEDKSAGS